MRFLITGAGGMLGQGLLSVLDGADVLPSDRAARDSLSPSECRDALDGVAVVLNAAAWTDVDGAETDEEAATRVNGLSVLAPAAGKRLYHFSTDYVFDGSASMP